MGCESWPAAAAAQDHLHPHGEAQHNLEAPQFSRRTTPTASPTTWRADARVAAGVAAATPPQLLGGDGTISAVVSPFERTQQTRTRCSRTSVTCVFAGTMRPARASRVGNQVAEDMPRHGQTAEVGRPYYRRPTGESGAYVRPAPSGPALGGSFNMQNCPAPARRADDTARGDAWADDAAADDALLVWSPPSDGGVQPNCYFWVLVKDEARRAYRPSLATLAAGHAVGDAPGSAVLKAAAS